MQHPIDDDLLVAYLDGELPVEQHADIDQRLKVNVDLQQRVAKLRASWDILGELPIEEPRRNLAQSTIEIVTLAMEKESRGWQGWISDNRWLVLSLASLIMFAAGIFFSNTWTNVATQRVLANLPSIVDYPSLAHIDSTEFLEKLLSLRSSLVAVAGTNANRALIGDGKVPAEIDQRRTWVENLQDEGRGRLENHLRLYISLSNERKEQVQQISQKILENPQLTPQYLETIRAYGVVLDRLGVKTIAELQEKSVDERISAISAWAAKLLAANYVPTASDAERFRIWLNQLMENEENLNYFLFSEREVVTELLYVDPEQSLVSQQDVANLIAELDPTPAKLLNDIADESARRIPLGYWISSTVSNPNQNERPAPGAADLEKSFESLSPDRKNAYEFLPEEVVRKLLRESGRSTNGKPAQ